MDMEVQTARLCHELFNLFEFLFNSLVGLGNTGDCLVDDFPCILLNQPVSSEAQASTSL
jgi:hypothetical protein